MKKILRNQENADLTDASQSTVSSKFVRIVTMLCVVFFSNRMTAQNCTVKAGVDLTICPDQFAQLANETLGKALKPVYLTLFQRADLASNKVVLSLN